MTVISDNPDERQYAKIKRRYEFGSLVLGDGGLRIAPARVESQCPSVFRQAVYPDGKVVIQGAYAWSQGNEGGVIWKDLPLVYVDVDGQELQK